MHHQKYWIVAEQPSVFNDASVGPIEGIATYRGAEDGGRVSKPPSLWTPDLIASANALVPLMNKLGSSLLRRCQDAARMGGHSRTLRLFQACPQLDDILHAGTQMAGQHLDDAARNLDVVSHQLVDCILFQP